MPTEIVPAAPPPRRKEGAGARRAALRAAVSTTPTPVGRHAVGPKAAEVELVPEPRRVTRRHLEPRP